MNPIATAIDRAQNKDSANIYDSIDKKLVELDALMGMAKALILNTRRTVEFLSNYSKAKDDDVEIVNEPPEI